MARVSSNIQQWSNRLVEYESQLAPLPLTHTEGVLRVCEKLRTHLTLLIGSAGYHALITRTLALLGKDNPWLADARIEPDGALILTPQAGATAPDSPVSNDARAIPSQLLTLLATFIGEPLVLNLTREVWPLLPVAPSAKQSSVK